MTRANRSLIIILIVMPIIAFLPFSLTMAPSRELHIVDESDAPAQNATARQIWYQYSLGISGKEDFQSDSTGLIKLPKREVNTNILSLIAGAINKFKTLGIHASYTSDESIGIFTPGHQDKWFYNGKGIKTKVILTE